MFILLFLILLIQFFNYWLFAPFTTFFEYFLEIRFFLIFILLGLILLFSAKNIED